MYLKKIRRKTPQKKVFARKGSISNQRIVHSPVKVPPIPLAGRRSALQVGEKPLSNHFADFIQPNAIVTSRNVSLRKGNSKGQRSAHRSKKLAELIL